MKKLNFLVFTALFVSALPAQAAPAPATPPPTKCITAETKRMRDNADLLFNKDTAPYINNADAAPAIAAYRHGLDVAWSALEQPYCGYAQNSMTGVKKSFTKTVTRARAPFLEKAKTFKKGATETPAKDAKPAVEPTVAPLAAKPEEEEDDEKLTASLNFGMRSDDVLQLQKVLARYFKIADTSTVTTGYFGEKTEELVIKFQIEQGIVPSADSPGAGLVGPKTLKALNAL